MSVLLAVVFLVFAGFSYFVLRKTHKKGILVTYTVMLGISMIIFLMVAVAAPIIKSKYQVLERSFF